jgi:hypothetical protein
LLIGTGYPLQQELRHQDLESNPKRKKLDQYPTPFHYCPIDRNTNVYVALQGADTEPLFIIPFHDLILFQSLDNPIEIKDSNELSDHNCRENE